MKPLKFVGILSSLFIAFSSCKKDCSVLPSCGLEPDPGMCEAYIPKYYFDKAKGKCEEFIWGGCGGTVPFDSMEECLECECE